MKRRFLLLSFLLSMAAAHSVAQTLCNYDFNSYTLGNLSTDFTGTTPGQGGWYMYSPQNNSANKVQVVADPTNSADYVIKLIGGTGNTNHRWAWSDCVTTNYGLLGTNDSVIIGRYQFYMDASNNTSTNRFGLAFYDFTVSTVLAGAFVQYSTGNLYLLGYANAGTPAALGTYYFNTGVVLSKNTWYEMVVIFNKNTGRFQGGYYNTTTSSWDIYYADGAAAGTQVYESDFIGFLNSSTTTSNGYFDNLLVYAPSLAPVTFTNFSGNREGHNNLLFWNTATESNNRGFDIQRSADGTNFTTIGTVNSLANGGNSSTTLSYTYTDANVSGSVQYYRLRQVDNDGRSSLSNVIAIRDNQALSLNIVGLYPNPASNVVNLSVTAPVTTKATLLITGVEGRILTKQALTLQKGMNAQSVDISNFSAGTYLVKIIGNNGEVAVSKFVKK